MDILFTLVASVVMIIGFLVICRIGDEEEDEDEEEKTPAEKIDNP